MQPEHVVTTRKKPIPSCSKWASVTTCTGKDKEDKEETPVGHSTVPASSKACLLGILSEGAMKMNAFPKVNMVGMEKDRLHSKGWI